MVPQFIEPNWHVIMIHYPLGLLSLGVVIEILGLIGRSRTFHLVARWLILLGALLGIPTALAGVYAFRDVVAPGREPMEGTWYEAKQQSHWTGVQWELMTDHIWETSAGIGIFVVVVVTWLASTEQMRQRKLWYALMLVASVAGLLLLTAGAWNSGEAIYRYGTAVAESPAQGHPMPVSEEPEPAALPASQPASNPVAAVEETLRATTAPGTRAGAGHAHADHHENEAEGEGRPAWEAAIDFYVPPLQLHVILAGLAVALAAAALGLSIKRWDPALQVAPPAGGEVPRSDAGQVMPIDIAESIRPRAAFAATPQALARPFPGRLWVFASLFAILAAGAGVWSVGGLSWAQVRDAVALIREPDHGRLLWHVVSGVVIVVLPLLLAITVRVSRQARLLTIVLAAIVLVAVAWQVWSGILMTYDSHEGPLTGFSAPPTTMPSAH